jgi:NAD(P)-dependent dehydrogenase (short-subunit alcohol dehydrogenase family)
MRIVMTGATAGFGLFAAARLVETGHKLTIGARSHDKLPPEISGRVCAEPLDLDSLAKVRVFAKSVDNEPIDVLLLNAGLQLSRPAKSTDGFERTFAVNHLAHYLLLRLLVGKIRSGGRIILTGSGTHDPEEKTPVTPPLHSNAEYLAFPDRDPQQESRPRQAGFRAYSSSKLCNIMTAREAAKRYPQLSVIAFDPGYVPHTNLGRDNPKWVAALVSYILPLLMKRDRSSSIPRSGEFLADLVLNDRFTNSRGDYWAVRGVQLLQVDPSVLARDETACAALWEDSARLVGMPCD